MPTEKLYCYIDETGQDTKGRLFVVSVVVAKRDRDELVGVLEQLERDSGKGYVKWRKAKRVFKYDYIERVLRHQLFAGKIFYRVTERTQAYHQVTLNAIAATVRQATPQDKYKASVFIDGLPRGEARAVGTDLRKAGIATEKVRGVRDETNALIRLADAVAGVIRDGIEGIEEAQRLRHVGSRAGSLRAI
jgi:hypothetical protein